jgi:flagellar protein FliO/FliZ
MRFKKLLPILFLLSSSIACSVAKQEPDSSPSLTEQLSPPEPTTPPSPAPEPNTPRNLEPAPELAPAPLPSSDEMTNSYENAFVRMLVTLLGLVFLVFATFWILRRLGKGKFKLGGGGRMINVIERRALSPKSMLYIVEIGNKKVLISESQLEVRALTSLEDQPELNE